MSAHTWEQVIINTVKVLEKIPRFKSNSTTVSLCLCLADKTQNFKSENHPVELIAHIDAVNETQYS